MDGLDVVAIPAKANYSTFDSLRLGRSSQQVVGRLLRFWDAKNIKKDGEFMGISLMLLDEKCSVIQCFIPSGLAGQHRTILREGIIFGLGEFELGRSSNLYKTTDHPFVIRFLPSSTIEEVTHVGATIEKEKFMIRKAENLQALANTNLELPDVVDLIKFVQGSNLDEPTSTQRLVVRFMLDTSVIVNLALWDEAAATFRSYLTSGEVMNSVMLVTTINPKLFGGNLYLNSTPATRFFFDKTIEAIKVFTNRTGIEATKPFTKADTSGGIRKMESVSIAEPFKFISKTNEQAQEADFLCKAKVLDVLDRNGWSYVSCAKCSRKLEEYETTLRCPKCISPNVTGVVRYRVELAVHDGQEGATFIVFDSEMTKFTNKTAATIVLEEGDRGDGTKIPSCVQDIIGKKFLFQIRVTPFNFTSRHQTFTVSKITSDTPNLESAIQVEQLSAGPTFLTTLKEGTNSDANFAGDSKIANANVNEDVESCEAGLEQKTNGLLGVKKSLKRCRK